MKLSVKSDYAARAVLALARSYPTGKARRVEELAEEQGVSANYLVQILLELKAQQLVRSLRGKEGGYLLAKAPEEISLGDILRCMHGQVFESPALADEKCPPVLRRAWEKLQKSVTETADAMSLQDMVESESEEPEMYYI